MEVKNGKNRSSKVRKGSQGSESEGQPRSLGTVSTVGASDESNQIGTSRENCNESDTFIPGEQSLSSIPGKIIGQLVDETEKQLAYHEQQAEVLRERLKELKQIPDISSQTDQTG